MTLNHWYRQSFSDQTLYFKPTAEQKNGGYKGVLVTVNHFSRGRPKAKSSSVGSGPYGSAAHWSVLWRFVDTANVPEAVRETAHAAR